MGIAIGHRRAGWRGAVAAWVAFTTPSALLMAALGLALAGGSMYLLIRWLGLGVGAASWAGIAYEIFPYEAQRTAAFPPLGLIHFAPLLVMAGVLSFTGVTVTAMAWVLVRLPSLTCTVTS